MKHVIFIFSALCKNLIVRINGNKARQWYKKANDQKENFYQDVKKVRRFHDKSNNKVVRQDYAEVIKWCEEAANQGHIEAQYNLGVMYEYGQGVNQDNEKAKESFGKACDNGLQKGCDNYRILN